MRLEKVIPLTSAISLGILVLPLSVIPVLADAVSISTEKSSYVIDEIVAIIGKVGNVVSGQDVRIDIYNSLGQVFQSALPAEPDIQGRYSADVYLIAGIVNDVVGEYKAVATYNGQSAETKFNVTSIAQQTPPPPQNEQQTPPPTSEQPFWTKPEIFVPITVAIIGSVIGPLVVSRYGKKHRSTDNTE